MRTTLNIDDDLHAALRVLARSRGVSLGTVVSELVRKALTVRSTREPADDELLPSFEVPEGASIIPSDRAEELMADEGIA